MYSPLQSLKEFPDAYIQFDLKSTPLHVQPVKVSFGVPLQGLRVSIVLFLDWCLSVSAFKVVSSSLKPGQGHQPPVQINKVNRLTGFGLTGLG